jgi:RND superfamily putative drug exporter
VLLPAVLELLGERTWWLPRWLDGLLPHFDVEVPAMARAPELSAEPSTASDSEREQAPEPSVR